MEETEKKEKRSQGDHLRPGVVQADIIMYILNQNEAVPTTKIRDHLKDKYGIRDRKNIKRHYNILKSDGCIEIVSKGGGEDSNIWDITTIEHLKNIGKKIKEDKNKEDKSQEETRFKNINLNKHEKVLMIILKNLGVYIRTPNDLKLYLRLFLIPSFFEFCVESDPRTMYLTTWNFYRHDRGLIYHSIINKHRDNYEKDNKEKVKTGDSPTFSAVNEKFLEILRELPEYIPENPLELYGPYWEKIEEKISKSSTNEDVKKSLNSLFTEYLSTFNSGYLILISDHFFGRDNINNNAIPEEIEFMEKTADHLKLMLESNRTHEDLKKWYFDDLGLAGKIMAKYKQPNILNMEISDNPEEVKKDLIENFGSYFKQIEVID